MAMSAVRNWFGRHSLPEDRPAPDDTIMLPEAGATPLSAPIAARLALPWTRARLATTDTLWGDGYQLPGGELETLRLARPLGLSKASSLLLLGAGGGGAACSLAKQLGVWVSGFESDPNLVAAAGVRIAHRNLGRHAQSESWNPFEPHFREHFYHHALALEALHGSQPERTLSAIAMALRPAGHLMMLELVADSPLDPADPVVAAWARLERRDPTALPTSLKITRTLGRLGFDVRVAEDVSDRHTSQALTGWRTTVRAMQSVRPTRQAAMHCVQEAELWLLRVRLIKSGMLRQMRWHAIGK